MSEPPIGNPFSPLDAVGYPEPLPPTNHPEFSGIAVDGPLQRRLDFREDVRGSINRNGLENLCNTPDYVIAQYLLDCFNAFIAAANSRDRWWEEPS